MFVFTPAFNHENGLRKHRLHACETKQMQTTVETSVYLLVENDAM